MKQHFYCVHDCKAETFMSPFCVANKGIAIRAFEDCVNSESHHFGEHPSDYTLFEVGEFDTDTGYIEGNQKECIGNGVEFLKPPTRPLGENNGQNRPSIQPDEDG